MNNSRSALWLILASQLIFLLSSLIERPTSAVMIIVRVVLPLVIVVYIGLLLTGKVSRGGR